MNNINSIGLLKEDPKIDYKQKAFRFLRMRPEIIKDIGKYTGNVDMFDLSSFSEIEQIETYVEKSKAVLVSPLVASRLSGCESNIYTAYPLRQWAIGRKITAMAAKNICGAMTSLRIHWSVPRKDTSGEKQFLYVTVAGLIDLAEYLAGSPLRLLHLERVTNENNLFGLLTCVNNLAVELEINETLPNTMEAMRFIRAEFTDGSLTNMPIVGFRNEEGAIIADEHGMARIIVEDASWDGDDEIENTYWQQLMAIATGTYPVGPHNSRMIIAAIDKAINSKEPVYMENLK
jgi:hypothetical protein